MNSQDAIRPMKIENYFLPEQILNESFAYLKKYGRKRYEGYMCWSGIVVDGVNALIKSGIYPKEYKKSSSRYAHAGLDLNVVFDIGDQVYARSEFLFVQLHTHPFEAFHSSVDDNFPISHKVGFISIVIPFYARKKFFNETTLVDSSVNEYLGDGVWRELSKKEVKQRFKVIRKPER